MERFLIVEYEGEYDDFSGNIPTGFLGSLEELERVVTQILSRKDRSQGYAFDAYRITDDRFEEYARYDDEQYTLIAEPDSIRLGEFRHTLFGNDRHVESEE